MGSSIFLTDPALPLVADTSSLISLLATGCAPAIVRALPKRLVVASVVTAELERGRNRGHQDLDRLNDLVTTGLVEIAELGDLGWRHFEELTIGPVTLTLDDGEAATIAHAVEITGTAVIDERKATRICSERFPGLPLGCTVDMLIHPDVLTSLGKEGLAGAVFSALQEGRMRVFPHHIETVVALIGNERASRSPSLPRAVRQAVKPSR